jgi:hypothetical protein
MPYCLLQTDAVAPAAEQLKRAFMALKTLTEADAIKLAREACGILMKNLSLEDAGVLQRALQGQGVATELVDSTRLSNLPGAKVVHRIEFQPQTLAVFDPLGRSVPVPWQHMALISAGSVRHFGMSATRTEETVNTFDPIRGLRTKVVTDLRHKVEDNTKLMLDIFLSGGVIRYQIEAERFPFKYCFDRPELTLPQRLGLLIQMFAEHAPHAIMNRGAVGLREGKPENAAYASKAVLFDESIWLLWRMAKKN